MTGPAAAEGELVVRDFVLTNDVVDREPTNEAAAFTTRDEKAFAFARINNTGAPTTVKVVWRREGMEDGSVWLNVGMSSGWRTWSSANIRRPGNWSVTLVDADTVRVTLDPALPDQDCCTITLSGDAQDTYAVRLLAGDVSRNGVVNATDKNIVKGNLGRPVNADRFLSDVNATGIINEIGRAHV